MPQACKTGHKVKPLPSHVKRLFFVRFPQPTPHRRETMLEAFKRLFGWPMNDYRVQAIYAFRDYNIVNHAS